MSPTRDLFRLPMKVMLGTADGQAPVTDHPIDGDANVAAASSLKPAQESSRPQDDHVDSILGVDDDGSLSLKNPKAQSPQWRSLEALTETDEALFMRWRQNHDQAAFQTIDERYRPRLLALHEGLPHLW